METLKKFDYFPKLSETVEVRKTSKGGLIFAVFSGIMIVLGLIELHSLFFGEPFTIPVVEKPDLNEKVRINLNISLFDTPCEALSLDLQDVTGSHFEDLQQTIYKLRLDERGYIIDRSQFEVVQKLENKNFFPSHPIWEKFTKSTSNSCYGAELFMGQECKTCQEVMSAYNQRGWPVPQPNPFIQCKGMKTSNPRMMSEEFGSNFTENMFTVDNLIKEETRPQFYLGNALYEVGYIKEDEVFSFDLIRKNCNQPQNAFLEFSYLDHDTNTTKQVVTTPIFFRPTQCKASVPIRIHSFEDPKLDLELLYLEDKNISININNGDIFNVKVLGDTPNTKVEGPSALFQAGSGNVFGRKLHAEFYGYDDFMPAPVSQMEVDFFRSKMGTGCQVVGTMFINKVPGNFHISTHHKGQALYFLENNLTAHHKIHLLEFTREDDKITQGRYTKATNPLDGKELHTSVREDVQYFLKIVGSSYTHPVFGETKYYEFVAHEDITMSRAKNMILLEFKMEFDPISMKHVAGRESLTGFIVSLLAIIGGIFATSTYIDRLFNK